MLDMLDAAKAKRIAELINTVRTADLLYKPTQHHANSMLLEESDKAVLELANRFGVKLPELPVVENRQKRKHVPDHDDSPPRFKMVK